MAKKIVKNIEGFDTKFTHGNLRERFGNKHILFFGETSKAPEEIKGKLTTNQQYCIIYDNNN